MAGISSALGTVGLAKQTAKGSPAATPTVKLKLSASPSLMPIKERGRYVVTDTGRDNAGSYTSRLGVAGEFSCYLEPSALGLAFYLALGANADSGAGPNYTHTATPANDLPYFTLFRSVGGVIFEIWEDCKLGRLGIEGGAGSPYTMTLGVEGRQSRLQAADSALAALEPAGLLFMEGAGQFQIDTVARTIHRLALEINNNVSPYQADDYNAVDIDPGKREIGLTVATRFGGLTAWPDYHNFFYNGVAAPAALSPVVATHAMQLLVARNANLSWQVNLPQVTYAGVPVQPDPGGDPIEIELACEVEKPSGATPIITVVSKDQAATV